MYSLLLHIPQQQVKESTEDFWKKQSQIKIMINLKIV